MAAVVTGGVICQAGGASGWWRVGVWLVPSFVRGGGREGRSDDLEAEGAQSAVSRAGTVTVASVADVATYIYRLLTLDRVLYPLKTAQIFFFITLNYRVIISESR